MENDCNFELDIQIYRAWCCNLKQIHQTLDSEYFQTPVIPGVHSITQTIQRNLSAVASDNIPLSQPIDCRWRSSNINYYYSHYWSIWLIARLCPVKSIIILYLSLYFSNSRVSDTRTGLVMDQIPEPPHSCLCKWWLTISWPIYAGVLALSLLTGSDGSPSLFRYGIIRLDHNKA